MYTSARDGVGFLIAVCKMISGQILLEPGYVLEDCCNEDGKDLRESGRPVYDNKYRTELDDLFPNVSAWLKKYSRDHARVAIPVVRT